MTFQFTDLIEDASLQLMQNQLYEAIGVESVITLPDGSLITNPDNFWSLFFKSSRNKTNELINDLLPNDKALIENIDEGPILNGCLNGGMYCAIIPIIVNGELLANWIIGPVKNEEFNNTTFVQNSNFEDKERELFIDVLSVIPLMSKDQFAGIAKMGKVFILQIVKKSLANYYLQSAIEKYQQQEVELLQDKKLLKALMDIMPDHIYFKDRDSRFITSNKSQLDLFGLSDAKQIIGKTDFDFFSAQHATEAYNDEQYIIKNDTIIEKEENETWNDRPDSWVSTIKAPLKDESGTIIGTFGISRDITLKKIDEEKLLKDERIIQEQNNELKQINAQKDKLFSIIAHDLRSPFNSFLGFTELLEKQLDTMTREEITSMAGDMKNSATRIYNLLSNLLEWSRLQRGMIKPVIQHFLLNDVVQQCVEALENSAHNKNITIRNCIPDDFEINADPNMLQIIVHNLLTNAIKFTFENGNIELNTRINNKIEIEIAIADTGIGMSPEMVNGLFHIDIKTNRQGTDGEPSTGLGLILCKEFIEQHGGKIWVESKQGQGSTFRFTIPYKK